MELDKKKSFYLFLIINFLAWSLVQLTRNVISIDAMEAVSWGEMVDFGTNKHPPFSGWIMAGAYNLFGQSDWVAYFLGSLFILIGFIFLYKLAKFFMDEEKAMCASMIISSCYYYTYILFIDNFNCNFVSMALWPMIAYYFYKSIKEDKIKDWILFGVVSAIAALTKYQVVFLFTALFLYLIFFERSQFKKKGMYISVLIGSLIILPHIIWLFQHDFFSMIYMSERTEIGAHNTPLFLIKFGRVVFPLKFILDQILSVASCIVVYLFLALQAKNIKYIANDGNKSDRWYLLFIGLAPIIMQGCMAIFTDSRIQGIWGSIMVCFAGILLFYFFPVKFNKDSFSYFMKWAYSLMAAWLVAMLIFSLLQTKRTLSYPYQKIMPEFNKMWKEATSNAPFKYVGGHIDYVFQFHIYNDLHPIAVLETFGYKNPCVDHKDIIKSGILIVGKSENDLLERVKELIVLLPEKYDVQANEYTFKTANKFGKEKEYKFYYAIIPPLASD